MFITFEGLDFCGKSTQVELLKKYFEGRKREVIILREPGGTAISEKIRDILLDKAHDEMRIETELLLFAASRAQLVRQSIIPALKANKVVISDRFHDSSTAYQGFGRGIDLDFVFHLHNFVISEAVPDLTFFIDLPLEIINARKSDVQKTLDRIESSKNDFYENVRKGYFDLAERESRFRILNGRNEIDEIHKQIISEVESY